MKLRLFVFIFLGFIVCTVVGTLSHEVGHWTVAKIYGSENARIGYAYTTVGKISKFEQLTELYKQNKQAILDKKDFPEKATFEKLKKEINFINQLITWGGPIQTMLTGTVGFLVLLFWGKRFLNNDDISFGGWCWIFTSLFWLRQSANFTVIFIDWIQKGELTGYSDELRIARYWQLPLYSVSLVTALIGFQVLAWITFRYLPTKQRATFLFAGGLGGVSGYVIWFEWVGKYILP